MTKIYLAGPFLPYKKYKDWRDFVKEKAPQHKYWDPRNNSEQYCSLAFVRDDLIRGIKKSELVFCYNPKDNVDPYGFCLELGVAFNEKIPIVLCDENEWIFPMFLPISKRLFTNLEIAVNYLANLKTMDKEFEAFYKTIQNLKP